MERHMDEQGDRREVSQPIEPSLGTRPDNAEPGEQAPDDTSGLPPAKYAEEGDPAED